MKIKESIIKVYKRITHQLDKVTIPGFRGRSVYQVSRFFFRSLFDEDLMLRTSSLAYNFFLSLFPALIFLFTLLPFIPIPNFQEDLLFQIEKVLPKDAYSTIIGTIEEILQKGNLSLLSFGFLFALYFSSNAFNSMMSAFNKYIKERDKRPWYISRWRSLWLTFLIASMAICMVLVFTYVSFGLNWLNEKDVLKGTYFSVIMEGVEYFLLILLVYFSISTLYYYGSSKISEWSFFSPGSTLATLLSIAATTGFTMYVNSFNSYNKLYGSIGTIIVLMVLIYFNCLVLLIGFELNSSIDRAKFDTLLLNKKKQKIQ